MGDQSKARRVCFAAYISFKLMDEVIFGLIDTWMITSRHPERNALVRMSADMDSLKITHLLLTLALPLLLRPFRLQMLFLATSVLFVLCFFMLVWRLATGEQLVSNDFYLVGVVLTLLMLATDAVADAICRSMRVYLQPVRKVAGLLCTISVLAQVHLPSSFEFVPLACLFLLALCSALYAALEARGLSPSHGALEGATDIQSRTMSVRGALLFSSSVLVGDNGEEIIDVITNLKISEQLRGGSTFGFDVKHGINLIAQSANMFLFWKRYKHRNVTDKEEAEEEAQGKGSEVSPKPSVRYDIMWSLATLVVWGLFQGVRLLAWVENPSPSQLAIGGLILGDKLVGSAAQDAIDRKSVV